MGGHPSDRESAYLAVLVVLSFIGASVLLADATDAQRSSPATVIRPGGLYPIEPMANETLYNNTPVITVGLNASHGPYKPSTLVFLVNGRAVQFLEDDFRFDGRVMTYQVSSLFRLAPGQQNVTVQIETESGDLHRLDHHFFYSAHRPKESNAGPIFQTILIIVTTLVGVALLAVVSWVVYLTQIKGWSWRKFTLRFHLPREIFTIYLPAGAAVIAGLAGLFLRDRIAAFVTDISSMLPDAVGDAMRPGTQFMTEYIILAVLFIGVLPYALDVQRQRRRQRAYERAYAQFLFEMADAMRGGIDPMKAVLGLAKTETGLLRDPLRVAADGIRIGRPFETVLVNMARPMKSTLVTRYAMMVGAAAKVGGDISNVIYRAAKDMDDMVKIEGEKLRAMRTPVMTIYIAFGVLLMMVNTLMDFGPQLTDLDMSALTSGQLGRAEAGAAAADAGPVVERLTIAEMQTRFFHLLMITSIGSGLLIGAFSSGKIRFGLVHMLVMVVVSAVFYPVFVL